jgi:ABC-type lipoprotein release transport system permease subunit
MATRPLRALLFGITPGDPLALSSAAAALALVTMVAAFVPALRAARVQPGSVVKT